LSLGILGENCVKWYNSLFFAILSTKLYINLLNISITPKYIETVKKYVNNYNKLWKLIKKISEENLKRLRTDNLK